MTSVQTRSHTFKLKLEIIEKQLQKKLQLNYSNVKKCFLELDTDQDGFIDAEDLARFLKNSVGTALDYTMLEYLIKVRCKQNTTQINYTKFCAWLGPSIEPIEAFYFRHDSNKNPQYDLNMRKSVYPIMKTQKEIRKLLTGTYAILKEKFIEKVRVQFKTIKRAFKELDRHCMGCITLDHFEEIVLSWGFEAK